MAIDPSIIGGLKPLQLESPTNALAQMLQVQNAQQQNQLGQAKLDEHQRTTDRGNRLNSVLAGLKLDASTDEQVGSLTRGGFLPEARSLAESSSKVNKEKRESEKFELESHFKKFELAGQIMNGVKDQASWDRAKVLTAQTFGAEAAAQMPDIYDPVLIEQKRAQAMSVKDKIEAVWKEKGYDLEVSKADEAKRHNKSTESLTAAGQAQQERASLRTDARAGETLKQGKTPPGYRQGADGRLVPIPGGPADPANKAPTEFQGKSAAFGARAEEADRMLQTLGAAGTDQPGLIKRGAEGVPLVGGVLGSWVNGTQSAEQQRVEQAQRDFVNAVLRQESGAAIGASEFENAQKQYFPQSGDTPAVKAQKARNRKLSVQGLQKNAGHAAFSAPAADDVHSAADAILNGGK